MISLFYTYPTAPGHRNDALATRFVDSYLNTKGQTPHKLIVICNGAPPDNKARELFGQTQCDFFEHDDSGWDIGGYIAAARRIQSDLVVCFGGSTYFPRTGWLDRMHQSWEKFGPGMYGATATFEVSPHLNTTAFWCTPQLLAEYPIKVITKYQRYDFEHGPNALWKLVAANGLPVKLVTWDGEYDWWEWRKPNHILRRGNQGNCLTWWHHIESYAKASQNERMIMGLLADTITDPMFSNGRTPWLGVKDAVLEESKHRFIGAHRFWG